MSNYTENFTSTSGDTVNSAELETEFDAIAAAVNSKVDADGSGTMTGALNMGNNKITNLTDPTSAQDAASKNYVDTAVVADYSLLASAGIATAESVADTLTVTIPSSWNGYVVEFLSAFTLDFVGGTQTTNTQINVRIRATDVSGTIIGTITDVMGPASDGQGITSFGAVFGYQEGQTSTGSRTFVLTVDANQNALAFNIVSARSKLVCRRTS